MVGAAPPAATKLHAFQPPAFVIRYCPASGTRFFNSFFR
jgi:hypothetical protein